MIRRKDSLGYVDFMRGKYPTTNKRYIENIISEMTNHEKSKLLNNSFLELKKAAVFFSINVWLYTTGVDNIAIGSNTLVANTTGDYNVAIGKQALQTSTTVNANTAVGYRALMTSAANINVAVGYDAMANSTTAGNCVAVGG